jgi:hypothetical protein
MKIFPLAKTVLGVRALLWCPRHGRCSMVLLRDTDPRGILPRSDRPSSVVARYELRFARSTNTYGSIVCLTGPP